MSGACLLDPFILQLSRIKGETSRRVEAEEVRNVRHEAEASLVPADAFALGEEGSEHILDVERVGH